MMKRANSGKKPGELVDRISSLPDSILSLILSFLPTKNAVYTCLLSKRWEFLWRTVINLDFCQDEVCRKSEEPEHEADMKFVRFVNSVLLLHDVGFLNKFRLVWKHRCIPSQINPWISTAIARHVRELVVCLENSDRPIQMSKSVFSCNTLQYLEFNGYAFVSASILFCLPRVESLKLDSVCFQSEEAFEKLINGCPVLKCLHLVLSVENSDRAFQMCTSVFNCGTLQSLDLKGYMFVSADIVVCLPRLESLKLDSVCFQSEEAFEKLISECPLLKYLHVRISIPKMTDYLQTNKMTKYIETYDGVVEFCVFKFVVSSTSLRRLELYVEYETFHEEVCLHSSLELEATSLEYLKLFGHIHLFNVQESLCSLVEADLGIKLCSCEGNQTEVGDSLMKALHSFSCVKALTLSEDSMLALNDDFEIHTVDATLDCWYTKFKRLVKLKAGSDCIYTNLLQDLMQGSDCLEVLTLDKLINYEIINDTTDHGFWWSPPEEVPRCLSNSLKTVEFTTYAGYKYEREMVGYMLEHGSGLEIMKLSCDSCRKDRNYEFIQEICKLPRKSPKCKIEFSG